MTLARRPSKIVCIGRNYVEHAKELGNDVPKEPLFFLKPPSSLISDGEAIVLPPQSERVEFEGEIAVIIGRTLRNCSEQEAMRGVTGVVALNDVTARDLQRKDSQWTRAKGFDTFCAVGTPSRGVDDFGALELVTRVNGEVRQHGFGRDMVFSVPYLISYVSHIMTLEPGDVLATGTPAGVAPLNPGDVVEVEIVGVSRVKNSVRLPN
jgi:2-keto-4-pentenoate hydratase/2-oxohepta-3-ene-1,7-dioic acid hydratase in catechol pathway